MKLFSTNCGFIEDGVQTDIRSYFGGVQFQQADIQPRMVADNIEPTEGGGIPEGEPRVEEIIERMDKVSEDLESQFQKMGNIFFEWADGEARQGTRKYISDVCITRSISERNAVVQRLCEHGRDFRGGMFGFSVEDDHIHIIHSCAWSNHSCRCKFRREIIARGLLRPTGARNKYCWELDKQDWRNVFAYFFLKKRGTRKIWVRGESWQPPTDAELVRWEEIDNTWRQMVRSQDSGSDVFGERRLYKRSSGEVDSTLNDEVYGKKSKTTGKYTFIKQKTKEILLKYHCCPLTAIRDMPEFRACDILTDPKNKDYISAAFNDFSKDLNDMSVRDFENLLKDKEPVFMTSMAYGDLEESTNIIDQLLRFQFDDDEEKITEFLCMLIDILDKRVNKLNALCIQSPPSGGKNFFFDMILAICINYGQLGQANRHNVFAFQEAPNKRLLIWNEPNYESSLTDTLKMMFAGDPFTVRVKFSEDTHVKRTPVIILTNNPVPFMYDPAFKDRVAKYTWKAAPFLKDIDFKPYPMCLFDILKKYNILY